jgi:hypothetical protein
LPRCSMKSRTSAPLLRQWLPASRRTHALSSRLK